MSALYRPLPDSKSRPPDAGFMVPNVPSYLAYHREAFVSGMSQAITEVVASLQEIRSRTSVEAEHIGHILNSIAKRRREIAREALDNEWELFGKPLEKDRGPRDLIPADDHHRHYSYLGRACRAYAKGLKIVIPTPDGGIAGSEVCEDVEGGYVIQHPSTVQCAKLASIAFGIYSKLFENRTPAESDVVNGIAEATYLLMHGTPYVRGTPACVQALNDVVARIIISKTFPKFDSGIEPFWEAIFTTKREFISSYRDFFE